MKISFIAVFTVLIGVSGSVSVCYAQNGGGFSRLEWSTTQIDSTFDAVHVRRMRTSGIVAKYKPQVDELSAPIGVCPTGMERGYPEAPLSNWATDALRSYAQKYVNNAPEGSDYKGITIDFSLLNFGGIRTEMPVGPVSRLDVMSIFPFDNYLVIIKLKGSTIRSIMERFARRNVQAMSGVRLLVKDKALSQCLINGAELDDNRDYYLATIDFLLSGGDNLYGLNHNEGVITTEVKVMDLIISTIQDLTAAGKPIAAAFDGRVIIE